jgi:hypothetical protein
MHRVNLRNQKIALEGNNVIAMDPQIAQIFNQSTSISGKSWGAFALQHLRNFNLFFVQCRRASRAT